MWVENPGITVVLEPDGLHVGGRKIPPEQIVHYLHARLTEESGPLRKCEWIYLHARAGTRFGEAMRAIYLLSKTSAKHIGVFPRELEVGTTYE